MLKTLVGFLAVLVVVSPKSHAQDVTVPLVVFENETLRGAVPVLVLGAKLATGGVYGIDTGSSVE
jgi:hypothetical protein